MIQWGIDEYHHLVHLSIVWDVSNPSSHVAGNLSMSCTAQCAVVLFWADSCKQCVVTRSDDATVVYMYV